mgnify:CR=1 FL=1
MFQGSIGVNVFKNTTMMDKMKYVKVSNIYNNKKHVIIHVKDAMILKLNANYAQSNLIEFIMINYFHVIVIKDTMIMALRSV